MASIRDLRNRIKSVGNIRQITRAMEMVASTKLRRFQEKAVASRPYSQEISRLVPGLVGDSALERLEIRIDILDAQAKRSPSQQFHITVQAAR